MNLEELQESLEEVFGVGKFTIETNSSGEVVIFTGLREDDDGELSPLDSDEDDEEEGFDPDFEPLDDEDDSDD